MPFIRYLHRSEEKKCCHGDNDVALATTFWCVALQKWCLRTSYTCAVAVLSTHDWVMNFLGPTDVHNFIIHSVRPMADKSCMYDTRPNNNTIQLAGESVVELGLFGYLGLEEQFLSLYRAPLGSCVVPGRPLNSRIMYIVQYQVPGTSTTVVLVQVVHELNIFLWVAFYAD